MEEVTIELDAERGSGNHTKDTQAASQRNSIRTSGRREGISTTNRYTQDSGTCELCRVPEVANPDQHTEVYSIEKLGNFLASERLPCCDECNTEGGFEASLLCTLTRSPM